jgi:DNA-binding NtrC family response regulator
MKDLGGWQENLTSAIRMVQSSDPNFWPFILTKHIQLHTSSMAMTHVIFDICAMPEYAELLRSEAQTALAQDGGQWQFSTIQKLRRLDSFLKESQRMNQSTFRKSCASPTYTGFDRSFNCPSWV